MKDYNFYKGIIDKALDGLPFGSPKSLYEPIIYTLQLPAKRLRPVLTLISAEMAGGDIKETIPAALSIELFHNFTLLHDDIMDEAPLRRGEPSVFYKFGRDTAILSGDALMIMAYQQLAYTSPDVQSKLFKVLNQTALGVCEGQQLDIEGEINRQVSLTDYQRIIEYKTALLIGAAMQMGALSAGADDEKARAYFEIGRHMGLAFQIQDDLFDTFGNMADFGKKLGGDIVQNKLTFLLSSALEKAGEKEYNLIIELLRDEEIDSAKKIKEIKSIYNKLKVSESAVQAITQHYEQALLAIESLSLNNKQTKPVREILDRLISRSQ